MTGQAGVKLNAEHRHGTDLELRCRQCRTSWPYGPDAPTQCPDCLDHLGELIDPEHPDWCMRDRGRSKPAGHKGKCWLVAGLSEDDLR
jgi:hypothetical protein